MNTLALCRRVIFTLALLLTGAIVIACIQTIWQQLPALWPVGNVLWGFGSSLGLILATWVVGRIRSWRSWSTWFRLTTYFLAFAYGGMLFDATQDWWTDSVPAFQLPGLTYEAYGRPLITILPVLSSVLLLLPVFRVFRWTLDECDRPLANIPISVLDLLSWTALAAVIFTWIRFLSSELAPQTGYSSSTISQNFREQAFHLFLTLLPASVLMTQLFAWRSHWLIAVVVLIVGWVVDSLATGFATHAIAAISGSSFGVLSDDSLGRWCYIGGRSLMGFTFGGLALLFGIRIRQSQAQRRETTEPSDAHGAAVVGGFEVECVLPPPGDP